MPPQFNEGSVERVGIFLLVLVAGVGWLWLSSKRRAAVGRVVEQTEVNERDRLAHVLAGKMKAWESADPENVGLSACLERGTTWVLEGTRGVAPLLAQMIAKSAYRSILREKIGERLNFVDLARFSGEMDDEYRRLERVAGKTHGVDGWWDLVDYEFEALKEKALRSGALDRDFVLRHYGRPPPSEQAAKPGNAESSASIEGGIGTNSAIALPACSNCDSANDPDASFCNGCGAKVLRPGTCGSCGVGNPPGAAFCKGCGTPMAGTNESGTGEQGRL